MTAGQLKRLNSGSAGIIDAARCPACSHPARIHNAVGCVFGPCECVVTVGELRPEVPRLEVPDGVESTPAARPAPAAGGDHDDVAAGRPAPADVPAAPVAEVRELPHWGPPRLPGGVPTSDEGVTRAVPRRQARGLQLTDRARAVLDRPRRNPAHPAAPTALGSAVVVGERDAAGEVAAVSGATGAAVTAPLDPEPLAPEPFLSAALYSYAAWYCTSCHQRRHDPGACPDCLRTLQPVFVAIIPRSLT